MSEAWLSSSEMIASCSPNNVSKTPPLASKHEEYKIVASVPRKAESLVSSSCVALLRAPNAAGSAPVQDNLAALSGSGCGKGLLPLLCREAVSDHRAHGLAQHRRGGKHRAHGVPRVVHLPAVDALDGDHVGDDFAPVDREPVLGKAEHRHSGTVIEVVDHLLHGQRTAGHLQSDVKTLTHTELVLGLRQCCARDVDCQVRAGRLRKL